MKHTATRLFITALSLSLPGCLWHVDTITLPTPYPPEITRLSRDTVWAPDTVTLYGKHLKDDAFAIGPAHAYEYLRTSYVQTDTQILINVPLEANTDYVSATNQAGVGKSLKQLVIFHAFGVSYVTPDSAPSGAWVTIHGSGFLEKMDSITILLNNLLVKMDSVSEDSMKFRVPPDASTGQMLLVYRDSARIASSNFVVTRPLRWGHITVNASGFNVKATHYRQGFTNYQHWQLDSTWMERKALDWQVTSIIPQSAFSRTATGLQLYAQLAPRMSNGNPGYVQISWDTIQNKLVAEISMESHAEGILPIAFTRDTVIYVTDSASPATTPDAPLELDIPFQVARPYIVIHDSESDHNNEYSWKDVVDIVGDDANPSATMFIVRFDP